MPEVARVEVVFATPARQVLREIELSAGATVADAIEHSGIKSAFAGVDLDRLQAGIWGRPVERSHVLRDGDRVEIYRPLEIEPMEARRRLADR